ncbi:hypothetical protein EVG14_28785, partial [Klebsiella pneumoniae]
TTMVGGGTGPAAGTHATTCTRARGYISRMLQAADSLPVNYHHGRRRHRPGRGHPCHHLHPGPWLYLTHAAGG